MTWMKTTLSKLAAASCCGLMGAALLGMQAAAGNETPAYDMGFRNITNLQADLFQALDRKQRALVGPAAVLISEMRVPCIASAQGGGTEKNGPPGPVQLSAGFVEFINHVAHAKAIDESDSGFFARYTTQLGAQSRNNATPEFVAFPSANARTFQIMNRQASHFNQMAGALVAIDLAHQYLGHYSRHAREFSTNATAPTPVNTLITEQEWREAVMRGANNALACGLGVEGLRALFDGFDRMQTRPAWAAYFIHPKANVSKISSELGKLERDFFVVDTEPQKAIR